mgnify:FL=1
MKLFIKDDCEFCSQIRANEINVQTINVNNKGYEGVMPPNVPLLQFDNNYQLVDMNMINTIFDEIRKYK